MRLSKTYPHKGRKKVGEKERLFWTRHQSQSIKTGNITQKFQKTTLRVNKTSMPGLAMEVDPLKARENFHSTGRQRGIVII